MVEEYIDLASDPVGNPSLIFTAASRWIIPLPLELEYALQTILRFSSL